MVSVLMQGFCAHSGMYQPSGQEEPDEEILSRATVLCVSKTRWDGNQKFSLTSASMWWVLFSILIQTGIWSKPEVTKTNPTLLPFLKRTPCCNLEIQGLAAGQLWLA